MIQVNCESKIGKVVLFIQNEKTICFSFPDAKVNGVKVKGNGKFVYNGVTWGLPVHSTGTPIQGELTINRPDYREASLSCREKVLETLEGLIAKWACDNPNVLRQAEKESVQSQIKILQDTKEKLLNEISAIEFKILELERKIN
jgi:hypothetical protein